MKNRGVEFGFFLLSIGVILLLVNIGIINWSILDGLFDLWPAIFIVFGINIIFRNNSIVRIITWLIFLGAIIFYGYFFGGGAPWIDRPDWKDTVSVDKYAETEKGELKIALGGTKLLVDSTGGKLIDAVVTNPDVKNNISYKDGNKAAYVEFKRDRYNIGIGPDRMREDCRFSLNDSVVWDMDLDTGAVNGTLDMSNLKVKNMDIDMGAGNLKLIFGEKYKATNVKIDAGASSFSVVVPKNAGVKIKVDGALNNTNVKRLNWNMQGKYYVSPNYESAASKIDMDIDMGVGSFIVNVQ